jgi:hypothetical protein
MGPVAGPVDIPVAAEAGVAIEETASRPPPGRRRRRRTERSWTRSRWPRAGRRRSACRGRAVEPDATTDFPDECRPCRSTAFGSVWDRQVGVPGSSAGPGPRPAPPVDDDLPSPMPSTSSPNSASRTGGAGARAARPWRWLSIGDRPERTESDRAQGSLVGRGVARVATTPSSASAHAMAPSSRPLAAIPDGAARGAGALRAELARRQAGAATRAAPAGAQAPGATDRRRGSPRRGAQADESSWRNAPAPHHHAPKPTRARLPRRARPRDRGAEAKRARRASQPPPRRVEPGGSRGGSPSAPRKRTPKAAASEEA